jgi:hypothetical protein
MQRYSSGRIQQRVRNRVTETWWLSVSSKSQNQKRTMPFNIEFSLPCLYSPMALIDLFTFSCNHISTFVQRRKQWARWIVYWYVLKVTKEGKHGHERLSSFSPRLPKTQGFWRLNGFHSKFWFPAIKSMCQRPGWVVCLIPNYYWIKLIYYPNLEI